MTSKSPVRSCEDIDDAALTYAEVKALATGNPYIKEKMDLDIQVSKLKLMKANHTSQKYRLEDDIAKRYPMQISALKEKIAGLKADIADYNARKPADKELFAMTVAGKTFEDRKEAGQAIIDVCKEMKQANVPVAVGEYLGMKMNVTFDSFTRKFTLNLKGNLSHAVEIGSDPSGNITRINNALEGMVKQLEDAVAKLENVEHQLDTAKIEVVKPFAQEAELAEKLDRLAELNALLNMDEKGDDAVDMDDDAPKQEQSQTEQAETDRQDGQTGHSNITYVDTREEVRKASEPTVAYGSKISEPKAEYSAKKPEKAESGRPFHEKLEAKKGEVAKQSPPKPAEAKSKQTSL
ncbi:MAG: helicase [Lachnospiraceae bacterium]|nr:helicase [Lachnospiraceae bacterium]